MMDALILAVAGVVVLSIAISMIWARRSFAPWLPSSRRIVEKALQAAQPTPGERFADLGCGDGRILTLANQKFNVEAHGFEISFLPYLLSLVRIACYRLRRKEKPLVFVHFKNLFTVSLSEFDIIFLYGLPAALNNRLYEKMLHELRPGTRVISYNFSLEHKTPEQEFHELWRNAFLYRW